MRRGGLHRIERGVGVSLALAATSACGAVTGLPLPGAAGEGSGEDGGASGDGGTFDGAAGCDGAGPSCCDGTVCADATADRTDAPTADHPGGEGGRDAGPPVPASCAPGGPGLTSCGASHESCCTSIEIPHGKFNRSYVNSGMGPYGQGAPATVSAFQLDKYLVTVGRFRQFALAWSGGYAPPEGAGKHAHLNGGLGLVNVETPGTYEPGWASADDASLSPTNADLSSCRPYSTWTDTPGARESAPISCVNWYEAYAFCIWDGGFLPSNTELEEAAAGAEQQREYPWGTTDPGFANEYAIYDCYYPSKTPMCHGAGSVAPVGVTTLGAGRWGHLDLAGELNEWALDGDAELLTPCSDCANLTTTALRTIRGGTFFYGASTELLSYVGYSDGPTGRGFIGFRCARAP